MGIESSYSARRWETLKSGKSVAQCYREAACWCERPGSNLDMFTALDVVGYPVWDGLSTAKMLEEILWSCGSKYLLSDNERATILCMAAAMEEQGL